jgi:hypothetical protein
VQLDKLPESDPRVRAVRYRYRKATQFSVLRDLTSDERLLVLASVLWPIDSSLSDEALLKQEALNGS